MKTRILTRDEIGELDGEQFDREQKRSVRKAWKDCGDYKRLALRLRVNRVLAKTSKSDRQGEYCDGTPDGWELSERQSLNIERNIPIIVIDAVQAFIANGIPAVIAHEIGHHLDHLANDYPKTRKPTKGFIAAFARAGLREYTNERNDLFSELIAETFGQYLRGHKLNGVLLAEVKKVLANLTRKDQRILQDFRNKQTKQNEGRN